MMKKKTQSSKIGMIILHCTAAGSFIALFSMIYFYILLPDITHHGETIIVPNLEGMESHELDDFLSIYHLRYEISDSSYLQNAPPFTVLQQHPKANSKVKENRKIYITINQSTPPTVPLPNLIDLSKTNAEAILKSNELKLGRIFFEDSPFLNLVTKMLYLEKPIAAETRLPKGTAIDLVIGNGQGRNIFNMKSLLSDSYEEARSKLKKWNLQIGKIYIPAGVDTTGTSPIVHIQYPYTDEKVQIGERVDLWLAPPEYNGKFPNTPDEQFLRP